MDRYDRNLILALEEINVKKESGNLFYNLEELLDSTDSYALYENCDSLRDVVEMRFKEEYGLTIPYDLDEFFKWDEYIELYKANSGIWFETSYGMVEKLI